MIVAGGFDIALIDATLPDASGVALAKMAPMPVLMLSDNPRISQALQRLGLQFLQKPFSGDVLLAEVTRVLLERAAQRPIDPPVVPIAPADLEALRAEAAQANRQFDAIVRHLGYPKA